MQRCKHLKNERETEKLGAGIAAGLSPGFVVHLVGDLGAGKTALARSILRALGFAGKVKSPTYTLVELYTISGINLYHFDLYRFEDEEEWADAGLDEYCSNDAILLIEWPGKGGRFTPKPDLTVSLEEAEEGRDAVLEANTEAGIRCLNSLD